MLLTLVEGPVEEGVIEEQAAALRPALRFSSNHQLTGGGHSETCRRRRRRDGGRGAHVQTTRKKNKFKKRTVWKEKCSPVEPLEENQQEKKRVEPQEKKEVDQKEVDQQEKKEVDRKEKAA